MYLFTGSYTSVASPIGVHMLDFSHNKLGIVATNAQLTSPSYVLAECGMLYAVQEYDTGASLAVFSTKQEQLQLLQQFPAPGAGMCHVCINRELAYGSNYLSGSVVGIHLAQGSLRALQQHSGSGPNPLRQEAPHVHSALVAPNQQLFVADLGLDRIMRYDIATDGALTPYPQQPFFNTAAGEGPRHFTFSQNGKHLFLLTELACTLLTFSLEETVIELIHRQMLFPHGMPQRASGADIHLTPNGEFLYVSLRGVNEIHGFSVNAYGEITPIGRWNSGGITPRSFHICPDGRFLATANQDSGNVSIFPLCAKTGVLQAEIARIEIPAVSCVKWQQL